MLQMFRDFKLVLSGKKRLNIRRRMMLIVLSVSISTLILLSSVAFYGIIGAKNMATDAGDEIGKEASENSSEILTEQMKIELTNLALDKAEDINHRMKDLINDVKIVGREMHVILAEPQRFLPQHVDEPDQTRPGQTNFYIQHAQNFNRAALADEIAMQANIKDMASRIAEGNSMIDAVLVASKDNFTFSAEDRRNVKTEDFRISPIIYDALAADWYKAAVAEDDLIFSNVREFIFSKKMGFFCAIPYYDEGGSIAGVACAQASLERINKIVKEVNLYNTGFCFVADQRGYIILSSSEDVPLELTVEIGEDVRESPNDDLAQTLKAMVDGQHGVNEITLDGKEYYLAYAPISTTDWSFAAAISKAEVIKPVLDNQAAIDSITQDNISNLNDRMWSTLLLMAGFVLALLLATGLIGKRLSAHFVKPINQLSDGVREIATGNLDKQLDIKTGDEIEHLATCFNAMTLELKNYMSNLTKITAEKERIATELDVAKNIQNSLLPNIFPAFPERDEFDVFASMNAAKEVGGDFYDFYLLDDNHLVVSIADVSGKGIPAALFMMIAKTILKNFSMTMNSPDDFSAVMSLTNNQLCQNNDAMMFVTVFLGMLDIRTGEFIFVNGGHNPPLVYHKSTDSWEYLNVEQNFVIGGMEDIDFAQQRIKLEPGDKIFMYTDGVTEALNPKEELYGEPRLLDCLNRSDKNLSVEELLKYVRADVNAHVNGADQSDDITMLALMRN